MHHPLDYTDDDYTEHRPQVSRWQQERMIAAREECGTWLPPMPSKTPRNVPLPRAVREVRAKVGGAS